ncbi:MAG: 30S ribosomal protein S6 [Oscillospiraceae bacterium]|nr:30S ribosomal protein S6 [Oscillospiraceae bacterium]
MAKLAEKYEAVVVFSLKKDEEQIKALTAKFTDLIKANGTLADVDEWGKRKRAYEINYESEGYYVLFHFESQPDFPAELERVLNITDGVLRFLVVLAQEGKH